MTALKLRAALTAVLLATAAAGAGTLISAAPAQAQAAVRSVVGKPLQEAQSLAGQKNWKAAMAKVNEAEAAPNKTPAENNIIAQMKKYIAVNSGDASFGPDAVRAKFANDYRAGKFKDTIEDGELLRKAGILDAQSMQIIAQAYYRAGDKGGCEKYIKANFGANPNDTALELLMRCAYENNDEVTQRDALETLVAHTGKPEYWSNLLKISEHVQGMRDPDTLQIYRLKLLTGTMAGKDDYITLAQLALQLGFAAESAAVLQKGQTAVKELNDDRTNKLLKVAQGTAATDAAAFPANLAKAQAAPQGEPLIKLGMQQVGAGKPKDAVATIQAGLAKPVTDKPSGEIQLGIAEYFAGQKDQAIKTLNGIKTDDKKTQMIAHLWSLAAHH